MTPAVDQLTSAGVAFETVAYDHDPDADSYGDEAAAKLGLDPDEVFKTLMAEVGNELVVAIVPTSARLDLKALARAAGTKKATMADPGDAERSTGYVVGGMSPFGQHQSRATYLDETALAFDEINVSGGRRGLELRLAPDDLVAVLDAVVAPIAAF
ncbi:MAG: Cys-tRNA(Pro) deacylase [Acidimicrobiales bacterium]|nr:Cys-tRNA(Pro) deacylase [Acidimicrobiales bacterium]